MRKFFAILSLVLCSLAVSAQTQSNFDTQLSILKPDVLLNFSDASGNIVDQMHNITFAASNSGTIDYHQVSSLAGRYAERFTYDAKATAPNTTLGNYDWAQPWWAVVRVNINFSRSNSTRLELFSKGTQNATLDFSDATGSGYDAWIQWIGSQASACLMLSSSVATGSASGVTTCLNVDIPNGIPVTLAFTYDGSGTAAGINIYAEGQGTPIFSNFNTQTHGTPNAHTMAISHPLVIMGDEANEIASQGGNVHNNAPTVVEEFAMGHGTLSDTTIQSLVALGNNWMFQGIGSPTHINVITDDDGCADTDNLTMLAAAIRLQRYGYLNLLLVNNTEMGDVSVAIYRQMLDESGLRHIPVSSSQGSWAGAASAGSACVAAVAAYNATNVTRANTQSDVIGYRAALAAAPDASVHIIVGGAMRGIFDLLNSPADGISSLTGQQLFAAKVVDIHYQAQAVAGGDFNIAEDIAGAQYVLANAGVPIYFYGTGVDFGGSGPNQQLTRVPTDPYGATIGAVSPAGRGAFDSWPLLGVLDQSKFWTIGTPGTVTIAGDSSTTFSTATNNKMYEVSNNSSYPVTFAQKALGSWFINSLVNPVPGGPIGIPSRLVAGPLTPLPLPAATEVASCGTQANGGTDTACTTTGGTVNVGDVCVGEVAYFTAPALGPDDITASNGDTVHVLGSQTTTAGSTDYLYWARSSANSSGYRFDVAFTGTAPAFQFTQTVCWRGADTTTPIAAFDLNSFSTGDTTVSSHPVTVSTTNSIVFSFGDIYSTGTFTSDPSYTSFVPNGFTPGGDLSQYKSQLTGTYTSTMGVAGGAGGVFDSYVIRP